MDFAFYIASAIACVAAVLVISRTDAIHALLYLALTMLALAVAFYSQGAHLAAALEVIVYAGAVLILFVFVIMMLNVRASARRRERRRLRPRVWIVPAIMAAVLLAELLYVAVPAAPPGAPAGAVTVVDVGRTLFGPYLVGVELASLLLLAALVAGYHLARPEKSKAPGRSEDRETADHDHEYDHDHDVSDGSSPRDRDRDRLSPSHEEGPP